MISIRKAFRGLYRLCQCNCGYLIPCINSIGNLSTFKQGHNRNLLGKKYKIPYHEYYLIYKPHFKYSQKSGYVLEHRYIMYLYLSIINNKVIYLNKNDDVHHINGNKKDNRIENLQLILHGDHSKITVLNNQSAFKTIDKYGRFCNLCGSYQTRINPNKTYNWRIDINGFLCDICYHIIRYQQKKFGFI